LVALLRSDMGAVKVLTRDQEIELGDEITAGRNAKQILAERTFTDEERARLQRTAERGDDAFHMFFRHNLRLVLHRAAAYQHRGLDYLDLIQLGAFGLIEAINKW